MGMGTVVVTGGSRGIGAAVCRRLAAEGYAVAVNYASDSAAAAATVAAVEAAGGAARAFKADVADAGALAQMFDAATEALGPLAGLVNNAGSTGRFAPVAEQDPADLARLFAVNVTGTILCCREAVLRLSTRRGGKGGAIVNLSSIAARLGGLSGLAPYAASKGAVESFTRGLATEVGPEGVRVNAVAPGMIETDMTDGFLSQPGARERVVAGTPLGRLGAPDDIAEAVAWLMSPAAAFVTGTVVTVSGGR
ncbi:NAD(P)-dependent dehydrogenase (short-subunit alcohol dehydrogenase family) [Roseiarcus fermentans]|uniref:NAD(P)-dependent dehydrogenase (Short-subunit alcohol dehydrogenase family) n=1 Tax=Roseiarcus fermentans TaxID=1473586 RepID=A0A366FCS8_9HYPH|nr:glucose 1-dehydrogenase [Roseiarcus fermentans]RBP11896.1 NAD(P)-dependent dehydrogenase (short-subunit alcohol dehydrogenase family) [Roseiarcus fermentans]